MIMPLLVCWLPAAALASPKSATLTRSVVVEQHVLRLDVAVDDARLVRGGQAGQHTAR